ncbi:MAG: hypothetical protein JWQ90_588 [Hydrocarboniphaga sp.]|uniref:dATP pyrophosphohydrolase n=1 Tax=Hydrocarboniphaga sp. TaxID=2033016 RepID=UPI00260AB2EC|nr:dATP pyrophosphohydrolase [Hydrocarboniphaga sp.]MDB5968138.1 hypothetical protein [Hydrocarboniphaga sp.]
MSHSSDMVQIEAVQDKAQMTRFIRVPARLQASDPLFVPQLELERAEAFSPKHNPYFAHAKVQFWIATRGGRDVGRISAQIDELAPSYRDDGAGHFGLIAGEDDAVVFASLFATAEAWLRERGCRKIIGPFNLSINEETGLLVDGFDTPPMILMGHDARHIGGRVEALGYRKVRDLYAYIYDITQPPPPLLARMINRHQGRFTVRPMDMSRYREDIQTITEIFNDAWSGNWGFVPYTPAEVDHLAKALKPLLDPRLVPIAEWDGKPVGFGVTLPDLNEAIRDLNGKLLPLGWAKLLWRLKVSGVHGGRVPLMGVRRSVAKSLGASVIPFLIIEAMRKRALERGFRQIELSWILEDNKPMRSMIETVGGKRYKTYRVYEKSL